MNKKEYLERRIGHLIYLILIKNRIDLWQEYLETKKALELLDV